MHRVGRRFGWTLLLQLTVVALGTAAAGVAHAQPKLVVVYDQASDGAARKQAQAVEAALHDKVALVPLTDYLRAAKALGARPRASLGAESAVAAGRAVGASHVLLFETVLVPAKRRRDAQQTGATLIDTQTGESLVERRTARSNNRAAQEAVARLVTEVSAALNASPAPYAGPALAVARQPQSTRPAPVGTAPSHAAAAADAGEKGAAAATPREVAATRPPAAGHGPSPVSTPGTGAASAPTPTPTPSPAPSPLALGEDKGAEVAPPAPAPHDAVGVTTKVAEEVGARPMAATTSRPDHGVQFQLGGLFYQRVALVREGRTPELRYGGGTGKTAPLFARVNLRFLLQPSRFGNTHARRWWDAPMLFGDADLGWARTATETRAATAPSGSWQLGAGWRQPLWNAANATVVAIKVGYSRYSFKVPPASRFVSDGFAGLLTEVAIEVPFGVPQVGFYGQAGLIAPIKGFDGTARLGRRARYALGGRAEAGLRFLLVRHLTIDVAFNWQRYRMNFAGPSAVTAFPRSYNGVGFSDQNMGGTVRLGLRF